MKKTAWYFRHPIWILLVLLFGCSTTTLTGVWQDPAYSGKKIHKVLVVGISAQDVYRRLFEDEFSLQLKAHGVEAVQGYTLFSDAELRDRNAVAERIKNMGFDAMLVSRMVGKRTEEYVQPGHTYVQPYFYQPHYYRDGWYTYYSQSYEIINEPPYVVQYQVLTMESNLYDAVADKLIWGAVSDTTVQGKVESVLKSYVKVVMDALAKSNLL